MGCWAQASLNLEIAAGLSLGAQAKARPPFPIGITLIINLLGGRSIQLQPDSSGHGKNIGARTLIFPTTTGPSYYHTIPSLVVSRPATLLSFGCPALSSLHSLQLLLISTRCRAAIPHRFRTAIICFCSWTAVPLWQFRHNPTTSHIPTDLVHSLLFDLARLSPRHTLDRPRSSFIDRARPSP